LQEQKKKKKTKNKKRIVADPLPTKLFEEIITNLISIRKLEIQNSIRITVAPLPKVGSEETIQNVSVPKNTLKTVFLRTK